VKVLLWHVHGSWTTAFVQGRHEYLLPGLPGRTPDGLGRARTWDWPANAVEMTPRQLRRTDIDAVVVQNPHQLRLTKEWTGRFPGSDLPAVYLEHNAPEPFPAESRHPMADRSDIPVVHVTHFNDLFWDCGKARTTVIEHAVVDPGHLYTGDVPHSAVVVNEPIRRRRYVGTDLLGAFTEVAPLDLFGMKVTGTARKFGYSGITEHEDLPQAQLHAALARRRVYVHPVRWTSLCLSLIEAMYLGMPVVAVAAT